MSISKLSDDDKMKYYKIKSVPHVVETLGYSRNDTVVGGPVTSCTLKYKLRYTVATWKMRYSANNRLLWESIWYDEFFLTAIKNKSVKSWYNYMLFYKNRKNVAYF